jgi:hypothetical protein
MAQKGFSHVNIYSDKEKIKKSYTPSLCLADRLIAFSSGEGVALPRDG